MQRRGSIALASVALSALACGQAATSTVPTTSPSPGPTLATAAATVRAQSNEPAMSAPASEGPERGTWHAAAAMPRERQGFDAVMLGDGTILAVGSDWDCHPGPAVSGSETADVYDPVTDTWSPVESLNKPRKVPATVVLDDGRALVLGGVNDEDAPFSSTKIFDPATRAWSDGPLLEYGRDRPKAVRLDHGGVLVVSPNGAGDVVTTTELSDRTVTGWSLARSLPAHVDVLDLVALRASLALAVGIDGRDSDPGPAALVYQAEGDTWAAAEGLPRVWATYLALPDGSALAMGGAGGGELWGDTRSVIPDVATFDPSTGRWSQLAPMMIPRREPQATVLADGRVLVAGGTTVGPSGEEIAVRSSELYDPATDRWTATGKLLEPRYGGRLIALDDGSALILGGAADYNVAMATPFCPTPLPTVERFWP
jgi:hypothetical protein